MITVSVVSYYIGGGGGGEVARRGGTASGGRGHNLEWFTMYSTAATVCR